MLGTSLRAGNTARTVRQGDSIPIEKNDNKLKRKARRLSTEELMLSNCGAEVDRLQESPLDSKDIKLVKPKGNQP